MIKYNVPVCFGLEQDLILRKMYDMLEDAHLNPGEYIEMDYNKSDLANLSQDDSEAILTNIKNSGYIVEVNYNRYITSPGSFVIRISMPKDKEIYEKNMSMMRI